MNTGAFQSKAHSRDPSTIVSIIGFCPPFARFPCASSETLCRCIVVPRWPISLLLPFPRAFSSLLFLLLSSLCFPFFSLSVYLFTEYKFTFGNRGRGAHTAFIETSVHLFLPVVPHGRASVVARSKRLSACGTWPLLSGRMAFVSRKINIQISVRFNHRIANWLIKLRRDYYDQPNGL